jgi:DNA-directed RNA polymerase subunit RPC12/RpoP
MSSELLVEEGKVISAGKGFAEISLTKSNLCQECSAKILCKQEKTI